MKKIIPGLELSIVLFLLIIFGLPKFSFALSLYSPSNNAEFYKDSNITFDWSNVSGASYYEIWIDNQSGFGSPEIGFNNGASSNWQDDGIESSSQFTLTSSMQNNLPQNVYYWKVRALDSAQNPITEWSSSRQFTLNDVPDSPNLKIIHPQQNEIITTDSLQVEISWLVSTDCSGYELSVDGNSVLINNANQGIYLATFGGYGPHKWKYRLMNADGTYSQWSLEVNFILMEKNKNLLTEVIGNSR